MEVAPGKLLVAPPSTAPDAPFAQAVILVLDQEPNGITTGLVINRPTEQSAIDSSALALLFVSDPGARVFWGGPMGRDPAILAQFTAIDGLEWFHLPIEQRRPFPLPDVGVVAVAEHPGPFEHRILRARLFSGLCVWGRGQLEGELGRDEWRTARATPDDVFSDDPEGLWAKLLART